MDPQASIPAPPAPPSPAEAAPARSPAERQAAMLERLAEIVMESAEALGRQIRVSAAAAESEAAALDLLHVPDLLDVDATPGSAPAAPARPPPVFPGDPALALSRVARAVRMTVGLWKQHTEDMDAQAAESAEAARERRNARAAERRARAARLVERIALEHFEAALPGEKNDAEAVEAVRRVSAEARERLDDEDLYGDLADLPFSEIVARLCADLGVSPAWAQLAGEPWAQAELAGGAVGAPLSTFSAASGAPLSGPPAAAAPATSSSPSSGLSATADPPPRARQDTQEGPPLESSRWRRRRALGAGPQAPPPQTLTVRFVEHDGTPVPGLGFSTGAPGAARAPPPQPVRPEPPEPSEEEAAAAARAAQMHLAEFGPRGAGRSPY